MPDYAKIQDEFLRKLVMGSESINSLPEKTVQTIIDGIASLEPTKQQEVIKLLESERERIATIKLSKGITTEKEIEEIEKNSRELTAIKHEYDNSIRQYRENKARTEDDETATEILKLLDTENQ